MRSRNGVITVGMLAGLLLAQAVTVARAEHQRPAGAQDPQVQAALERQRAGEFHRRLSVFEGQWRTAWTVWHGPGREPSDRATGTAVFRPILGGRFLEGTYAGEGTDRGSGPCRHRNRWWCNSRAVGDTSCGTACTGAIRHRAASSCPREPIALPSSTSSPRKVICAFTADALTFERAALARLRAPLPTELALTTSATCQPCKDAIWPHFIHPSCRPARCRATTATPFRRS